MVNVEEELETEQVEEVDLVQGLEGEVDVGAGSGQGKVLLAGVLNVCHHLVSLANLLSNICSLGFENLQGVDSIVIIKDSTLRQLAAQDDQGLLES